MQFSMDCNFETREAGNCYCDFKVSAYSLNIIRKNSRFGTQQYTLKTSEKGQKQIKIP
jgi:hypothetical protein